MTDFLFQEGGVLHTEISFCFTYIEMMGGGFPGGAVVKNPHANARDMGSSPGLGRSHMPWSN